MTQSHQFHKHVTDAKKKGCNSDEKEAQARSTTIPHPRTATKRRQRTTEKVDLILTFHFNLFPSEQIIYQTRMTLSVRIDPKLTHTRVVSAGQQSHTLLLQRTMENVNNFLKYLSRCACHSHMMNLQCRPNSCQDQIFPFQPRCFIHRNLEPRPASYCC